MRALIIVTAASFVFQAGAGSSLAQSAQSPPDDRRFEVASVKPGMSPFEAGRAAGQTGAPIALSKFGIGTQPGGRFTAGSTLKQLVAEAFDVKDYQIDGGPPWLATDYFDITANAGADATPADVKAMLRTLLAERFGLRTRSGTRQASVYVLSVARSDGRLGSRLTPSSPECIQQLEQRKRTATAAEPSSPPSDAERQRDRERMQAQLKRLGTGDSSVVAPCGSTMMRSSATGASTVLFGGTEIKSLVSRISSELSAPVLDQTGLSGLFDLSLEYLSERGINGRPAGIDPNSTDPLPPPLIGALQQQLGLKLEKQVAPMPIVIIDAAEHPTPD